MLSAERVFQLYLLFTIGILCDLCVFVSTKDTPSSGGRNDYCRKDDENCGDGTGGSPLVRLPGVEVGHVEKLVLNNNNDFDEDDERIELDMKTVSVKPLIFEIPGFLTDYECKHFIEVANQQGLQESSTYKGSRRQSGQGLPGVRLMDLNGDQRLSISEMMLTLEDSYDYYLDEKDVLLMYKKLNIDKNHDGFVCSDELESIQPVQMEEYLNRFVKANPVKRSRMSKQVWLFPDSSPDHVFRQIQERVQQLTQLPAILIKKSDFQVVNYGKHGHYNAHQDSSPLNDAVPCCNRFRKLHCRICRYMTILFYLNDVEGGGGTAFPLAGNDTYDVHEFRLNHQINLQRYCHSANLVLTPEKGKAVIWYNHLVNPETGWMGRLDEFTWHGGCPVTRGEKWIANFWIKTTDNQQEDLEN